MNRIHPSEEFSFMAQDEDRARVNNTTETSLLSNELSIKVLEYLYKVAKIICIYIYY